ncbi:heme utilization protein [Yersinia vastinensis]|uniref:heme utilization protein n=1 Tax=Yersinia vastinensis TaxID=2890318 RepID=UPI00119E70A1|nr:heme utilization protein [Yersinia vastinensis]
MKLFNLITFTLAFSALPNIALSHYVVENPQTSLSELTFDLTHYYLPSHETNHPNTCKMKTGAGTQSLQSCRLVYVFNLLTSSGAVGAEIQRGYVDLQGDGSYDTELSNATTHYNSLRVAEAHGVNLNQHVSIPYANISTLVGSNGRFRVTTSSEGFSCLNNANCTLATGGTGYTTSTIDLGAQNLDVACEASASGPLSIENTLSGEHIYSYNSNATRLSKNIGEIKLSVNCVNWLSTAKSKTLNFSITPNTTIATGGNTQVTCGAYRDGNAGTAAGYSFSRPINVAGFDGISEQYDTESIYYGLYVTSPSTSAETVLDLNCALSGQYTLN